MQNTKTLLNNRYSIVHLESTSNFSKVFFALDTYQKPPRNCVVKLFKPTVHTTKVRKWIKQEFEKEAKRLKQLSLVNRHLPEIYTYSSDSQVCYIVRELVEGEILSKKVLESGNFSPPEVRAIVIKLLLVLAQIHQKGIIHQNIKPDNIILRQEDCLPMLINFGSINQIVSTQRFYGTRHMFANHNIYGYVPPEQALGRSVTASDLYSLGLTAIYLLTAKKPEDLGVDFDSGKIKTPHSIFLQDPDLANIITKAISSDLRDRYSSAEEMLHDLQGNLSSSQCANVNLSPKLLNKSIAKRQNKASPDSFRDRSPSVPDSKVPVVQGPEKRRSPKPNLNSHQLPKKPIDFVADHQHNKTDKQKQQAIPNSRNWWKTAIYGVGASSVVGIVIIALYDWHIIVNHTFHSLPEPTVSWPDLPPETSQTNPNRPSMLNNRSSNLIEIPLFAIGTSKTEIRKALGEPNTIQQGHWQNTTAWIYKGRTENSIDMGYLFDLDTQKLRQVEVAIASSVGLGTIEDILTSLLEGKITPPIRQKLQKIHKNQATTHFFQLDKLEGSIQREADNQIHLGVWEADFHFH